MTLNDDVKQKDDHSPSYNIEVRMLVLIQALTKGKNDWKHLENITGIKAVKWRHVNSGVTKPSIEMLEALCRAFPEHAFWLTTGLTDYEAGHTAPQANVAFPGNLGTFFPNETPYTTEYFRTCLNALDTVTTSFAQMLEKGHRPLTKGEYAHQFDRSINFSIQLGAEETINSVGSNRLREIAKDILSSRKWHIEVMLERLREIPFVDQLIDEQRAKEDEYTRQFEKELPSKERQETKK